MKSIKDLIYFDYDKAKSLNSQLNGGIISELTRAIEEETELESEIGFDIKILKGSISGNDKVKKYRTEKIELYHELLNQIESSLFKKKILVDLNDEYIGYSDDRLTDEEIFIKAFRKVFSSFENFERFFFVPTYPKIAVSPIAIYREIKLPDYE